MDLKKKFEKSKPSLLKDTKLHVLNLKPVHEYTKIKLINLKKKKQMKILFSKFTIYFQNIDRPAESNVLI